MMFDKNKRFASRVALLAFVCISALASVSSLATPAGAASFSLVDSFSDFFALVSSRNVVSAGFETAADKVNTTIEITGDTPDPTLVGQAYNVSWQVTEVTPIEAVPTGTVTVSDGTDSCTAPVEAGVCALTSTTRGPKNLQATYSGDDNFNQSTSAPVEHAVFIRVNWARNINGGVASGSTELQLAAAANEGSRVWPIGGAWKDATPGEYPDVLQIDFNGVRMIDEISIFAVRDDFLNTTPPDETTTTSIYSLIDFDVEYWNGVEWILVPNGQVRGNNLAWVKLTFAPVPASRIRVTVYEGSTDGYSRIVELEAWADDFCAPTPGPTATAQPSPTATAEPSPTSTAVPSPTATVVPMIRRNHALATNGGTAAGSTELNPAANAIDGSRVWATGGAWKDSDQGVFPDTLQVNFNGIKSIDEISVFAVMDDYLSNTPPNESTTTSQFSLVDFVVQYWDGSMWVTVPGGNVVGNNKAWVKITFAPISTSAIRVVVSNATDGFSRIVELEALGDVPAPTPEPTPTIRVNHALEENGGAARGSTELNSASNAIDGSRVWAVGGSWKDRTPGVFPDLLQVDFYGTKTIDEISVFAVMDDFTSTVPPDLTTMTTQFSLIDIEVQTWDGSAWTTVPGGNVMGNNKAWVKLTFAPISTSRIRVLVKNTAGDGYSRIVELEAWGDAPSS